MAKVYADLIRKGLKTIDDVPESLKAAVQALLDAQAVTIFIKKGCVQYGSYLCNTYHQRQIEFCGCACQNQRTGQTGSD